MGLPGCGGVLRQRPEDFHVVERPAYDPDGREGAHLLFTLRKRGLTTPQALDRVARHLRLPRRELGVAGLKDRDAVTEQWVSAPADRGPALATFRDPDVTLGPPQPHGNKLRRGHLRGNHFHIRVRMLGLPQADALARVHAKIDALHARGGMDNLFGLQRFGRGGRNALAGLDAVRGRRRARHGDLVLSAGQSLLFNHLLLARRAMGAMRRVLLGDVLQKTASGGLFVSEAPKLDQARLDAGEVTITGPIFGSKTLSPPPGTPAHDLEQATLDWAAVTEDHLRALGRRARGTRRRLLVRPAELTATPEPDDPAALALRFTLPAGSYATVLLHELQAPFTR